MIITHSTLEDGYDFYTTNKWGINFHFRIHTFPVPSSYVSKAILVVNKQKALKP